MSVAKIDGHGSPPLEWQKMDKGRLPEELSLINSMDSKLSETPIGFNRLSCRIRALQPQWWVVRNGGHPASPAVHLVV